MNSFSEALNKAKEPPPIGLYEIAKDNPIGVIASKLATERQMPIDSVFLAALACFSATAMRRYRIEYQEGGSQPLGLYAVIEQPSGSGKSSIINSCTSPSRNIYTQKHEEQYALNDDNIKPLPIDLTDVTSASLEKFLSEGGGFASIISAEQAAVDTVLGLNIGTSDGQKANKDIILKGYNGDWTSSGRVSRKGFIGEPIMAICVFAQQGTIDSVFNNSHGTGLAERFFMLSEPDMLGKRNRRPLKKSNKVLLCPYTQSIHAIANEIADNIISENKKFGYKHLTNLQICEEGWNKIYDYMNDIEPTLGINGKNSGNMLRSAYSKADIHIMKIAANLHLAKYAHQGQPSKIIGIKEVCQAIDMTDCGLNHLREMIESKGLSDLSPRLQYALNRIPVKTFKPVDKLVDSLRKRTDLFDRTTDARNAIMELHELDLIKTSTKGNSVQRIQ